jgi:hypothetical protein
MRNTFATSRHVHKLQHWHCTRHHILLIIVTSHIILSFIHLDCYAMFAYTASPSLIWIHSGHWNPMNICTLGIALVKLCAKGSGVGVSGVRQWLSNRWVYGYEDFDSGSGSNMLSPLPASCMDTSLEVWLFWIKAWSLPMSSVGTLLEASLFWILMWRVWWCWESRSWPHVLLIVVDWALKVY